MLKRLIVSLSLGLLANVALANSPYSYVALADPKLTVLKHASLIAPVKEDKVLNFNVWLKLRDKAQFDQLVSDIYNPHSPRYRKFLTAGEFEKHYAPSAEAERAVVNYFLSQGMKATIINHRINVVASIKQIEQCFNIKLNYYRYRNRTVFASTSAPLVRADIAPYIAAITGLDDIVYFEPALRARPPMNVKNKSRPFNLNFVWDQFVPFSQPTTTSFNGFTGSELQTTLQLSSIAPVAGTAINGAGNTIVIMDVCGGNSAKQIRDDANLYSHANSLPEFSDSNFAVINPDGTKFVACGSTSESWNKEIALDVESSHTVAPNANIVLVLSQTYGDFIAAFADVVDTLKNNDFVIAGFSNAYVISDSWGGPEYAASPLETTFATAASHGISVNFSTGDCGDNTYNSSWPCTSGGSSPSVEYPASSIYVTAVGGTSLFVNDQWAYAFEGLWGSYYAGAYYGGTTGGISQFYGPVSWQSSISSFTAGGYTSGTVGSYNKRALPDIAMLADPYTGLTIYEKGQSFVYGGTSLACPLFSASLTLVNQARHLLNGVASPIGHAAPYLYQDNATLSSAQALYRISPPHLILFGAKKPPSGAPVSAFTIRDSAYDYDLTFSWDSSLTIAPEAQFWNDGVGVGSPNLVNFIATMARL